MNVVLIAAAICFAIVGIVGAIVPGLAGPPFSFLGLLAVSFVEGVQHSPAFLIVFGIIGAVIFVLDYIVPAWGTRKFGGTKAGMWGSILGLIAALTLTLFFNAAALTILAGPFFGAYIGERIAKTPNKEAWRAAFGSFIGFLVGTLLKLIYAFVCLVFIVKDLIGLLL